MEIKDTLSGFALNALSSGQGGRNLSNIQGTIDEAELDSFESKLRSAMTEKNDAELKDACVQFEEVILGIIYKQMKATVHRSDLLGEDPGRETYEQWHDDMLVKEMAKNGSFGVANMMYKQLSKTMVNAYELIDEETPVKEEPKMDAVAGAGAVSFAELKPKTNDIHDDSDEEN